HLGDCCYRFVGSEGSLDFPKMSLWQYSNPKEAAWHFPMIKTQEIVGPGHPLIRQVEHFGNVIKGEEQPRSSAKDAANTLSATLSVIEAAQSGKTIKPVII
ncbi:MAG: gfo/Idh/MocA family oxidoreductase, partial [Pseudomonadota bacterium]|nr:gfo/Idh/MocA family oxidoreductase [Pseudomonadota bacterium]